MKKKIFGLVVVLCMALSVFMMLTACEKEEPVHTHQYTETVTVQPACTTAGTKTLTCACGDTKTDAIPATGHSFVEGVCTKCSAPDPDYVAPPEDDEYFDLVLEEFVPIVDELFPGVYEFSEATPEEAAEYNAKRAISVVNNSDVTDYVIVLEYADESEAQMYASSFEESLAGTGVNVYVYQDVVAFGSGDIYFLFASEDDGRTPEGASALFIEYVEKGRAFVETNTQYVCHMYNEDLATQLFATKYAFLISNESDENEMVLVLEYASAVEAQTYANAFVDAGMLAMSNDTVVICGADPVYSMFLA